ncbi:zinc finger CCCH domain-containing protein 18 isoform X2 [Periplaneta americana]|uniref:zinc finger CCCH domain-containing protein 18 isoform X2 n=1 Tax=Periplaneta americana TaxID=6978 RepID=UPI0037E757B7
MDSDSSLDGDFETKHEIAVQARRDDEAAATKSETGDGSGDESGESLDGDRDSSPIRSPLPDRDSSPPPIDRDSSPIRSPPPVERDSSPIQSPPPTDKGELSPKSNNELSGSESDDISSASSIASEGRPASPTEPPGQEDGEISNVEERDKEENGPSSPVESEKEVSDKVAKKDEIPGHGEDLSDVSDLDSNDGRDSLDAVSEEEGGKKSSPQGEWKGGVSTAAPVEEMEQLDFEAEEQADKEEKEEGECEGGGDKSEDDGELKGDDLEEGELTDEDENRPEETEPRPVCRFYNRGQCTWGSSCRFVHPGVTDKGNYTMFDMVRPLVPVNGPPIYPPVDYRSPYEKPVPVGLSYQGPRKDEAPVFESAWERGLRQAKEMMRKSTKRKETDMDFEEKKMNLSLGQEELDKENDYYTRPASPILKDEPDRLKLLDTDGKYHHDDSLLADRYDDYPESPSAYYHQSRGGGGGGGGTGGGGGGDYWRRVHYEPGDSRAMRIETDYGNSTRKYHTHQHRAPPAEYYEKKKKSSHPVREVIMQRTEKPWRDERYAELSVPSHRGRGDEWADPWMRSKSPSGRKTGSGSRPSRRQSYSSGSSYSTSSSSRSSSQSSYSSYSHDSRSRSRSKSLSRSRSRSSSRTPLSRSRRKMNRPLVPTARAAEGLSPSFQPVSPRKISKQPTDPRTFSKASLIQSEKKAASERALLMNPPAPSPRKQKEVRPPSPGMMRKSAQNPPPPSSSNSRTKLSLERSKAAVMAAALSANVKLRSQSKSSRSSSGSDSSGSSSDSSESSYSSSSSSREPSPKAIRQPKRIVIDERERLALAQSLKVKAMDALKLSGQKQQIKLTLKAPGSAATPQSNKRPVTGLPELPELNLVRRERIAPPVVAGKKRPAEEPPSLETSLATKVAAMSKPAAKKATSRREELLKQLKAVEDAIARKRSKI